MSTPATAARSARIASLDGLRAISIALVLMGHLVGTQGFLPPSAIAPFGDIGNLGVRIFFVIFGFLITSLLLDEARTRGDISLKLFYLRRMRIFPAFYAYALVLALGSYVG